MFAQRIPDFASSPWLLYGRRVLLLALLVATFFSGAPPIQAKTPQPPRMITGRAALEYLKTTGQYNSLLVALNQSLAFTQAGKLTASDAVDNDYFGNLLALDGDTLAVGAPAKNNNQGAIYLFERSNGTWREQAKLTTSDAVDNDYFGNLLVLAGDTLAVTVPSKNNGQGAVYVFGRSNGIWSEQAKLTASDAANGDNFGTLLALDGDTLAVTVPGKNNGQGAVYVFGRSNGTWREQAKLTASDAADYDQFGAKLALDGDTLVVTAPSKNYYQFQGAVYVFGRSNGTWSEQVKLTASDAADYDQFGTTLALDGDMLAVGAPNKNNGQGAVYLFGRSNGTWSEQTKLTANDVVDYDQFGNTLALDGDTVAVAAPYQNNYQGAIYLFGRSNGTWREQTKLTAGDAADYDQFGNTLLLAGDTLAVTVPGKNNNQGVVYLFGRSNGTWSEQTKLTAGDATNNDYFGSLLTLDGDTVVVAAPSKNNYQGAVYAFVLSAAASEIDVQGNSVLITSGDITPGTADHSDFDGVNVSSGTIVRTFTIQNTGNAALSISTPTLSGANTGDFAVSSAPASSVVAGGSTTFQVTFDPSAPGVRTATITIANNDSDENPYTFAIQGRGVQTDADGDGIPDASDNCPAVANTDPINTDNDAQGNACDTDDDNDGVVDESDAFPLKAAESVDTDRDGVGNNADADDDGDGVNDSIDACPLASSTGRDADGNGCTDVITDSGLLIQSFHLPEGAETSLLTKANAALTKLNSGDKAGALNSLQALLNETKAQRGKKIPATQADVLTAFVQNVIAGL